MYSNFSDPLDCVRSKLGDAIGTEALSLGAYDFSLSLNDGALAILRCKARVEPSDHTALATMMTSGQCVWAAIVYEEREGSEIAGWVDAFHVSELDQLVSHLIGLRRALAGPVGAGGPL